MLRVNFEILGLNPLNFTFKMANFLNALEKIRGKKKGFGTISKEDDILEYIWCAHDYLEWVYYSVSVNILHSL